MADMISSTGSMDMVVKSNGVVDMSPTSIIAHNVLANNNCKTTLLNLKDLRSTNSDAADTAGNFSVAEVNSSSGSSSSSALATNLSTSSTHASTFRCERCENFETSSRAALLLHVVQCLSSHACLRNDDNELDNFKATANVTSGDIGATVTRKTSVLETQSKKNGTANETGSQHASSSSASSSSSTTNPSSRKVFECDVCNMKFSNGANMRRHKMRHTGVKPYECRVCQKRFFRKDHLAEHFTTHTKTLPYHCPICNRGFQRQIAMRAHFQNEHVGQHDLVKTCPLCSYRAGSMKSLRIHFFNRHGIDLDNPGACGTSSLLLALESQASQVAAAAAAASFVPNLASVTSAASVNNNNNHNNNSGLHHQSQQSDSSESMRSMENVTPPMHFLTPHVEISTLADSVSESALKDNPNDSGGNNDSNHEPNMLLDCNIKTPPAASSSSISSMNSQHENTTKNHLHDNHISPSISLIPIKQV